MGILDYTLMTSSSLSHAEKQVFIEEWNRLMLPLRDELFEQLNDFRKQNDLPSEAWSMSGLPQG